MKFLLDNWWLIAIALSSGLMLAWPSLQGAGAGGVTPTQVVQLMNREKAQVIDVCSPEEFAAGHVVGARNIPLGELEKRLPDMVKNKALPVVMVCAAGRRSASAVGIATKLGYTQAQSLQGGLAAWREANLPVEKA